MLGLIASKLFPSLSQEAPVWEIAGAEFTQSTTHTAAGVSIRFPRVTRIRDDKDWETATDLDRLKVSSMNAFMCTYPTIRTPL